MQSADEFRAQAERCRRAARSISNRNDPIIARLVALATEYDAKASALSASEEPPRDEPPAPDAAGLSRPD